MEFRGTRFGGASVTQLVAQADCLSVQRVTSCRCDNVLQGRNGRVERSHIIISPLPTVTPADSAQSTVASSEA